MNVLVIVAHPDDEILGCGATLLRLKNEGHRIGSVVLCSQADARVDRPEDLPRYAQEAAEMVGIEETFPCDFPNIRFNTVDHIEMVQKIEDAIRRFRPSWIFTHHPSDLNVDHRVCHEATMAAVMLPQRQTADMPTTMIERVYLCEVPSSTDWALPTVPQFQPNAYFNVASTIDRKIAALDHFRGAMKPFPHTRSLENVRNLAYIRGARVGLESAEAFMLVRDVVV
ncbi:MAG TPA: PIG-L family deacetylase [Thermoanaerobaculia bacterium]|nr:PIG-L family deacetylase [Thermoanaerobaculia bacterium]